MDVGLAPFQQMLDDHREDIYRFLVVAAGPNDADDCFQETFLSALKAYPRLRHNSNLRSWLFTIAHRKAVDAHRARLRGPVPINPLPERGGGGPSGEEGIWEQVRSLPAKQQSAILYRYAAGLSYREIAEAMNVSEEAARQNVRAGLERLKEVWPR